MGAVYLKPVELDAAEIEGWLVVLPAAAPRRPVERVVAAAARALAAAETAEAATVPVVGLAARERREILDGEGPPARGHQVDHSLRTT